MYPPKGGLVRLRKRGGKALIWNSLIIGLTIRTTPSARIPEYTQRNPLDVPYHGCLPEAFIK
jgi:hypothetical protein